MSIPEPPAGETTAAVGPAMCTETEPVPGVLPKLSFHVPAKLTVRSPAANLSLTLVRSYRKRVTLSFCSAAMSSALRVAPLIGTTVAICAPEFGSVFISIGVGAFKEYAEPPAGVTVSCADA